MSDDLDDDIDKLLNNGRSDIAKTFYKDENKNDSITKKNTKESVIEDDNEILDEGLESLHFSSTGEDTSDNNNKRVSSSASSRQSDDDTSEEIGDLDIDYDEDDLDQFNAISKGVREDDGIFNFEAEEESQRDEEIFIDSEHGDKLEEEVIEDEKGDEAEFTLREQSIGESEQDVGFDDIDDDTDDTTSVGESYETLHVDEVDESDGIQDDEPVDIINEEIYEDTKENSIEDTIKQNVKEAVNKAREEEKQANAQNEIDKRFNLDLENYTSISEYIKCYRPYIPNLIRMINMKLEFYLDSPNKILFFKTCLKTQNIYVGYINDKVEYFMSTTGMDDVNIIQRFVKLSFIEESDFRTVLCKDADIDAWAEGHYLRDRYGYALVDIKNQLTGSTYEIFHKLESVVNNEGEFLRTTSINPKLVDHTNHFIKATRDPYKLKTRFEDKFRPTKESVTKLFMKTHLYKVLEAINMSVDARFANFLEDALLKRLVCGTFTNYKFIVDLKCGIRLFYIDPLAPNSDKINTNIYQVSSNVPFCWEDEGVSLKLVIPVFSVTLRSAPHEWAKTLIKYIRYLGGVPDYDKMFKVGNRCVMIALFEKAFQNKSARIHDYGLENSERNIINVSPRFYTTSCTIYARYRHDDYRNIFNNETVLTYKFWINDKTKKEGTIEYIVTGYTELLDGNILDSMDMVCGSLIYYHRKSDMAHLSFRIKFESTKEAIQPLSLFTRLNGLDSYNGGSDFFKHTIPFGDNDQFPMQYEYFMPNYDLEHPQEGGIIDYRLFRNTTSAYLLLEQYRPNLVNSIAHTTDDAGYLKEVVKLFGLKRIQVPATEMYEANTTYLGNLANSIYANKIIEIDNEDVLHSAITSDTTVMVKLNEAIKEIESMNDVEREKYDCSLLDLAF